MIVTTSQTHDIIYSSGLSDMPSCLTAFATCLTASGGMSLSPCSFTLSAIDCKHKRAVSELAQKLYYCRQITALLQPGAPATAINSNWDKRLKLTVLSAHTEPDDCEMQQQCHKPQLLREHSRHN